MADDTLEPGDVVLAALPANTPPGHEQSGTRPVVIVGVPEGGRFPMLVVVPLTGSTGPWARANPLYPVVKAGSARLARDSVALTDHVRGVDAQRLGSYIGTLSAVEYGLIRDGLELMFAFERG